MNHHNELLLKVVDDLKAKNLGAVIRKTGKYIQEHSIGSLSERFEEIERNYSLIRDYMLKGYKDTSREAMCAQLLASMWNMVCDIEKYQRFMETGVYAGAYRRPSEHNRTPPQPDGTDTAACIQEGQIPCRPPGIQSSIYCGNVCSTA